VTTRAHTVGCVAKAVGYLRVSTSDQASSGLGLDAQQAAVQATATRLGLALAATFVDAGVSGGLALAHQPSSRWSRSIRARRARASSL
jgi:DNA invertase Pin-like site-specific DNA recombinase